MFSKVRDGKEEKKNLETTKLYVQYDLVKTLQLQNCHLGVLFIRLHLFKKKEEYKIK